MKHTLAQLLALAGLVSLGLSIARAFDLGLAFEHMRTTGDGTTFYWLLELLGTVYLPTSGALLLAGLLMSLPQGARLPRIPTRFISLVVFLLAFVVLVVVSARAVDRDALGLGQSAAMIAVGLDFAAAVPVAMLLTMLTASGVALWRMGGREAT